VTTLFEASVYMARALPSMGIVDVVVTVFVFVVITVDVVVVVAEFESATCWLRAEL
jgi:hypothetical protein